MQTLSWLLLVLAPWRQVVTTGCGTPRSTPETSSVIRANPPKNDSAGFRNQSILTVNGTAQGSSLCARIRLDRNRLMSLLEVLGKLYRTTY
ncbi:hypothetical protein COCSADRAFT_206167 [Bipolaris sorokiniana ND90Pr]|uniref:Secreted protein n=1 Tax=Cochliobolus sativus (strain ND90Pr / ATCC 201652) TaxID=665912 RepID=M2TIR3_COCSN|nr:uncharacterized protein COCSADRAFT_206167 [Bipolaris sorokiniana ND90Pr]EMD69091.1 hypothetical protein COCSADRAFT_206167 [Bipolaris sorokiniana ND90Pr]